MLFATISQHPVQTKEGERERERKRERDKKAKAGDYMRICEAKRRIHMGSFRHKTRVHSGTFRYIQDFSTALPLTGDLGNDGKCEYSWVHSVQPPQPYIILKGGRGNREGGKEHGWEATSRNLQCSLPL